MSTAEIKQEIQKVLDTVPETALEDILDFLKRLQQTSSTNKINLIDHFRQILAEDKNLLQRLAQ